MIYDTKNIVNVYANRFSTEWTSTDLRIKLGETLFDDASSSGKSGKQLVFEVRVGVTMTWLTAKELRDHLTRLINKYEEANGELVEGVLISSKSLEESNLIEPIPTEPEASLTEHSE